MNEKLRQRIDHLAALGAALQSDVGLEDIIARAYAYNPWFTPLFCHTAINAITSQMLTRTRLEEWLARYDMAAHIPAKKVGIIMAGNLPLVGFHDFLCVYITGHHAMMKLSGKDDVLFPYIFKKLCEIDSTLSSHSSIVERLEGFDKVIATGSNNSNRYFEYYFRKYPKILRKSRSSVAILTGQETHAELAGLADDIFMYFGFGCRNVSKLYVPEGYDITVLFPHFTKYKWMHDHTKYMNNYDYNRTLLLLNRTPHLSDDTIMLQENAAISSPVSVLYYEYADAKSIGDEITNHLSEIQCIVSKETITSEAGILQHVKFGNTQHPELWDYADNIDTIAFLLAQ